MDVKTLFVFPGQGTQTIGMGADLVRDFPIAKTVFEEVDDALHTKLSHLIFQGDLSELSLTENAQPAIMTVSMAVVRILESEGIKIKDAVAGHSLGEYSALCAAGVLTLEQTAILLQKRGQAMGRACAVAKSGMLALLGATPEQAQEIAESAQVYVANDNAPGQIVLSGLLSHLDRAKEIATQMNIKRAISLQVAGGFHSPLMQSAADEMADVLKEVKFLPAQVPVYCNVTAQKEMDPRCFAPLLTTQIVAPVRWRELIQNTSATHFVECGPGAVLSGLIKRIVPTAETVNIGTSESVTAFIK